MRYRNGRDVRAMVLLKKVGRAIRQRISIGIAGAHELACRGRLLLAFPKIITNSYEGIRRGLAGVVVEVGVFGHSSHEERCPGLAQRLEDAIESESHRK